MHNPNSSTPPAVPIVSAASSVKIPNSPPITTNAGSSSKSKRQHLGTSAAAAGSGASHHRSFFDRYRILGASTVNSQDDLQALSSSPCPSSVIGEGKYSVVRRVARLPGCDGTSTSSSRDSPAEVSLSSGASTPPSTGVLELLNERSASTGGLSSSALLAAKFIRRESEGFNPEEADILKSVDDHPHIVSVLDVVQYQSPPSSAGDMEGPEGGAVLHGAGASSSKKAHTSTTYEQQQQVIVMPFIEGGELFQLASAPSAPLSEARAAHYIFQILDALVHLHERGIVHRDIKLENVLVSFGSVQSGACVDPAWGTAKLIDFGFSKKLSDPSERSLSSCCGSPNYMSPEMLKASTYNLNQSASNALRSYSAAGTPTKVGGSNTSAAAPTTRLASEVNGKYGCEVDVWACGVALYVLIFGEYPFYDDRRSQWHKKILEARYRLPSWRTEADCSPELLDLLSQMLDPAFHSRLTASECLQHSFFKQHGLDASQTYSSCRPTSGLPTDSLNKEKKSGTGAAAFSDLGTATSTSTQQKREAVVAGMPAERGQVVFPTFTPPRNTHRLGEASPYGSLPASASTPPSASASGAEPLFPSSSTTAADMEAA